MASAPVAALVFKLYRRRPIRPELPWRRDFPWNRAFPPNEEGWQDTTSDAAVRLKKLEQATLIVPNVITEMIRAKYAASTSYREIPPSGRQLTRTCLPAHSKTPPSLICEWR